jgi:hypothetical protein
MIRSVSVMLMALTCPALLAGGPALAAEPAPEPPPPPPIPSGGPAAAPPAMPAPTPSMPPPTPAVPAPDSPNVSPADLRPPSVTDGAAGVVASQADPPRQASFGAGFRFRGVSVPSWLLDLFTKENVPLTSYAWAVEGFWRLESFDLVLGLGYQNMSPKDGNWLGRGKQAAVDTDFVQFRGLGFISADVAIVWRTMFSDWFGLHYGAGFGLGIVRGKMLRTSSAGCTESNTGDLTQCHPAGVTCTSAGCNEAQLKNTEGGVDEVATPHRFVDPDVPGAIPIVNVVVGATFRIPQFKGLEAKLEAGFYDAFFAGMGVGYAF